MKGITSLAFKLNDFNDDIKRSVASLDFQLGNTVAASEGTVKGTLYKKNMHVVLKRNEEGIVFGKIQLILVNNSSNAYFVTKKYQTFCLTDQGVHCLSSQHNGYLCISEENLPDYYPLLEYSLCGLSVIALHHSFPFLE